MLVGQQYSVMNGVSTVLPDFDFETYSEAGYQWNSELQKWSGLPLAGKTKRGLPVVGVYNYALHPSFEIIQLAYNLKDGKGARIWRPGMPDPVDLFDWIRGGGLIEAWNVFFETSIWNLHCVPKLGWPKLLLDQIRCCMAKAALAGYPRGLDNAGSVLQLVNQKDPTGKALVRKLTVPRNPTKKNPALRWTREAAPMDFFRFDSYNVQDIISEGEASIKIPDLSPRELEIWKVDQQINHRGMRLDLKTIDNCITIIQQAEAKYNAELRVITNNTVQTYNEVEKTLTWLRTQNVYLENLDEDAVEGALAGYHTAAVYRVLGIRKTLSFGSVKKLFAMRLQACPDERLRDQYAYAAAHTHLWNGQNVQVANLVKGKFNKPEQVELALGILASRNLEFVEEVFKNGPPWDSDDNEPMAALEVITHCLRSMIIAAPGARLIASDYTAIQAVVLAALAGEKWQLDVFHTHGKIYETTASGITGKPLQFYLDYAKQNKKHHPDRQLYGKIPTLASGFAAWIGGWRKFDDKKILGDDEQVKKLVLDTRAKIPNIVEFWGGQTRNKFRRDERPELYGLEGAAIAAVLNPGTCYGYRGIRYQVYRDVLYCLPPGEIYSPLVYHEPELRKSERPYACEWERELSYKGWNSNQTKGQGGWVRMNLYGGVLTQNIVAKVSREWQADALVELERTGIYLPIMHTHDEQVCEVEDGRGNLNEYLEIVNRKKPWAIDDWGRPWPVKTPDASETQRYGKWD